MQVMFVVWPVNGSFVDALYWIVLAEDVHVCFVFKVAQRQVMVFDHGSNMDYICSFLNHELLLVIHKSPCLMVSFCSVLVGL